MGLTTNQSKFLEGVADRILEQIGYNEHGHYRILIPDSIRIEDEESAEAAALCTAMLKKGTAGSTGKVDKEEAEMPEATNTTNPPEALFTDERDILIFSQKMIENAELSQKSSSLDARKRIEGGVALMKKNNGLRKIPAFDGAIEKMEELREEFENFSEVIDHVQRELILANAMKPSSFRIAPILLDGEPGVGKTAFSNALSRILDVPFVKLSAGGLQHAAAFTGTASHWSNAQTGEVFNMIARSDCATGIFLIDEVDKLTDRRECQVLPAVLDLLEPESARAYRDESMGVAFDASRLIVLMTSNVIANIDTALLSRCKVFVIKKPSDEQKMKIALLTFNKINEELKEKLDPNLEEIEAAVKADMDIRELLMMIRNGCASAIQTGSKKLELVRNKKETTSRQIGFVRDEMKP